MPKQVPFWQAVPPLPLSRSGALDAPVVKAKIAGE